MVLEMGKAPSRDRLIDQITADLSGASVPLLARRDDRIGVQRFVDEAALVARIRHGGRQKEIDRMVTGGSQPPTVIEANLL